MVLEKTLESPLDCKEIQPVHPVEGLMLKLKLQYFGHLMGRTAAAATAAKSLQSCPTLSDPKDCSLPGSSIHGIFQARVLEWGAIAFSEYPYYYKIIIEENYLGCMGTFYTIFSTFQ